MQKLAGLLVVIFIALTNFSFAQYVDSTKLTGHFGGAVSLTTNGISTIPSFTLGKPAIIFDMTVGRKKISFEPQFRFSLEGKPWSFLFWWRYKLITSKKVQVNIGAHPALNFRTTTVPSNGISKDVIVARRYLAGELSPNMLLTNNISVGAYYLYSHGFEKDVARHTHFLGLKSSFSNIRLTGEYFMRFTPQLFYLKTDKPDGFYFNSTLSFAKKNFPFSLSTIINKAIRTDIAGKSLLWNATLIYTFNKEYVETHQPVF